ncbi:GGDEF domain-containing protein [Vacuolonema iberomarrocanum]|uniref:GGDEF domain-containing protein n=1 Tax=Vacuolonema iberomarrocanum TaxID=3454632 RepID=UPI001A078053|nr:GGDEF domain-containing protein [filamentous cyanobacterium LEGE 07170]
MDQLTGLDTRADLLELIKGNDAATFLSVVLYDIDSFSGINHTFGYKYGDQILTQLGDLFREHQRQYGGRVVRWAGDEFLHVLCEKNLTKVTEIDTQFIHSLENQNIPYAHPLSSRKFLTVSAVIFSDFPLHNEEYFRNIDRAYEAIYKAKEPSGTFYKNGFEKHSRVVFLT